MTQQQSCDRRNFRHIRSEFILLLILLASVASLSAQTLQSSQADDSSSSTDLTNIQKSSSAPVPFGAIDESMTGLVDLSVDVYSALVDGNDINLFTGGSSSSGGGGGKASSNSLSSSVLTSMMKTEARDSGSSSLRSTLLRRAASHMPASYSLPVLPTSYAAISSAKTTYSPSGLTAIEEEELSENPQSATPQSTERQSIFEGFGGSFDSLEKIGESSQDKLNSTESGFNSLERLCSQYCGTATGSTEQGTANAAAAKQSRAARLSATTNRLNNSILTTGSTSDQLLGLQTDRSTIKIGASQGRVRSGGTLGGQQ